MGILALHIIKLRQRIGLSQEQLAMRIGVGTTTIKNLETSYLVSPETKLLEAIAETFGATVNGLLGKEELCLKEVVLIHVVSSIEPERPFVALDKVVDGVFMDRDKMHRYKHFGIIISDNALKGRGICAGHTAVIRIDSPIKNNDVVLVSSQHFKNPVVRVYHKMGDKIVLKADNDTDLYPDITLSCNADDFKIVGKLIKCEFYL